jgi:hypothetical protein
MKRRKFPAAGWVETTVSDTVDIRDEHGNVSAVIHIEVPAWKSKSGEIFYDDRAMEIFDSIKRQVVDKDSKCQIKR